VENLRERIKFSDDATSDQNANYVSLILIILAIFIALIRLKSNADSVESSTKKILSMYRFISNKEFLAHTDSLVQILKSHDVSAEVTVFSPRVNPKILAKTAKNFALLGIPSTALNLVGVESYKEKGIEVKLFKNLPLVIE
jgi:hypothetical protein